MAGPLALRVVPGGRGMPPPLRHLIGAFLSLCALLLAILPSLGGFTSHIFPAVPLPVTHFLARAQAAFTLAALAAVVGALALRRRRPPWRVLIPVAVGLAVVGMALAERRWAPARLFPPLDRTAHVASEASPWSDGAPVLGLVVGGEARAYPLALLAWHQVANDRLGGRAVAVTYCPLLDCARAYDAETDGAIRSFRFAGIARRNALLEARPGGAWFAQGSGDRVAGSRAQARLVPLPGTRTSWGAWRAAHPATTVLPSEQGYPFVYSGPPFGGRYAPAPRVEPRRGLGCEAGPPTD